MATKPNSGPVTPSAGGRHGAYVREWRAGTALGIEKTVPLGLSPRSALVALTCPCSESLLSNHCSPMSR